MTAQEMNYADAFIKECVRDIKKKGKGYVFTERQLKELQQIIKVKVSHRDDFAIYVEKA